jgi:hypothetical protein
LLELLLLLLELLLLELLLTMMLLILLRGVDGKDCGEGPDDGPVDSPQGTAAHAGSSGVGGRGVIILLRSSSCSILSRSAVASRTA